VNTVTSHTPSSMFMPTNQRNCQESCEIPPSDII
jgi:hypothetical protein